MIRHRTAGASLESGRTSSVSIQWYPGHMTRARRVMEEAIPGKDVVIEVLDARMPRSSANPIVTELRRASGKPCVKVLSKSDLADPAATTRWLELLRSEPSVIAIAITTDRAAEARTKVTEACGKLAKLTRGRRAAHALIVGIPNVGKSTLVNTLARRKVAKVGDEPAVTKAEQVVILDNGIVLSDNPGILWPKIDDPRSGLCLALGGAIPDSAIDYETVGLFAAAVLGERYPAALAARYKLAEVPAVSSASGAPPSARDAASALLDAIGRKRGCLKQGGVIDRAKASNILIHDFRSGALGRITLELPEDA